ncbi:WD40-repeat-containing domain protein [Trametes maxima]|nr:WD40-repeat-containing domain protein [Trametes maxima]
MRYVHIHTLSTDQTHGITCAVFSLTDGALLATSDLGGNLCVWDTSTGDLLYCYDASHPMLSLEWSSPSELICGLKNGTILIIGIDAELRVRGSWCHKYPVEHLSYDGAYLASGAQREVTVWKSNDREVTFRFAAMNCVPSPVSDNSEEILVSGLHWLQREDQDRKLIIAYMYHGILIMLIFGSSARTSLSHMGTFLAVSNLDSGFDIYNKVCHRFALAVCWTTPTSGLYPVPVLFIHGGQALVGGSTRGRATVWYLDDTEARKLQVIGVPGKRPPTLVILPPLTRKDHI